MALYNLEKYISCVIKNCYSFDFILIGWYSLHLFLLIFDIWQSVLFMHKRHCWQLYRRPLELTLLKKEKKWNQSSLKMEENDHHLCILCREIFTSLDSYVNHRKSGCKPNQEDYFSNAPGDCRTSLMLNYQPY